MKLVVFAHVPPPHHGQAVMVKLMLNGLEKGLEDRRSKMEDLDCPLPASQPPSAISCGIAAYHIDARVSDDIGDVGGIRLAKILRLLRYCAQAIWCRLRHGADTFYYVPAPAKKSAIVRDWLVMLLVRPWFKRTIFHWHAFGLGHWATGTTEFPAGPEGPELPPPAIFGRLEPTARRLTRWLLKGADPSIVLTNYNRKDAELLEPKHIEVVPNGIPDPCPDFEATLLPIRQARLAERKQMLTTDYTEGEGHWRSEIGDRAAEVRNQKSETRSEPSEFDAQHLEGQPPALTQISSSHRPSTPNYRPTLFRCLFLAHCTREKGLFDAIDAVVEANRRLISESPISDHRSPLQISLTVAGAFIDDAERAEFEARMAAANAGFTPIENQQSAIRFKQLEIQNPESTIQNHPISYLGFLSGAEKDRAMREHDCLLFPTHYPGETFGLTIIEAKAFGMPSVTSRWRGVGEIAGLEEYDQRGIADRLLAILNDSDPVRLRAEFLKNATSAAFHSRMEKAMIEDRTG